MGWTKVWQYSKLVKYPLENQYFASYIVITAVYFDCICMYERIVVFFLGLLFVIPVCSDPWSSYFYFHRNYCLIFCKIFCLCLQNSFSIQGTVVAFHIRTKTATSQYVPKKSYFYLEVNDAIWSHNKAYIFALKSIKVRVFG